MVALRDWKHSGPPVELEPEGKIYTLTPVDQTGRHLSGYEYRSLLWPGTIVDRVAAAAASSLAG